MITHNHRQPNPRQTRVFAEFERATIVDRTIAGMERKAARGEWVAGAVPLGYERGPRQPGCDAERLPAAALDDAVLDALVATYARHDLFARAARQAATAARTGRTQARRERAVVEAEIARVEAALSRYFATFEAGTMAEADCGMRVRELNERLAALRARRDDLDSQMQHSSPPGLTDEELRAFHHRVEHLLHHGSDAQRKAVVRALIVEVRVYGRDHIEPVFRIPLDADAARVLIVGGEAAPTGFEPVSPP